jgi:hypothetical protein
MAARLHPQQGRQLQLQLLLLLLRVRGGCLL